MDVTISFPLTPTTPLPAPFHQQVASVQAKLAAAEESYTQADSIAQAAMEAAEEAVRDEMETIAGERLLLLFCLW